MSSTKRQWADADWNEEWPVVGVRRGEPESSAGRDALAADGFAVVFDVDPIAIDADTHQAHLNNSAAVRMFNELRVAYVAAHLAPDWPRHLRRGGMTVVVRDLRVEYQSEASMDERFVGATRWAARRGKSGLVEQRLVEQATARPVARAWVVQLYLGATGAVGPFPDWFWDLVEATEGAPVPIMDDARRPWGPPT
ncbi:MAG: thioesterase family protein [Acidimicrobiia bacterium]